MVAAGATAGTSLPVASGILYTAKSKRPLITAKVALAQVSAIAALRSRTFREPARRDTNIASLNHIHAHTCICTIHNLLTHFSELALNKIHIQNPQGGSVGNVGDGYEEDRTK